MYQGVLAVTSEWFLVRCVVEECFADSLYSTLIKESCLSSVGGFLEWGQFRLGLHWSLQ